MPNEIDSTPQRELAEQLARQLAAAEIPAHHPVTGDAQDIHFATPTLIAADAGGYELRILIHDRRRPGAEFGYRIELPPHWAEETPPALLAGLIATEIVEVIEASTMGLPAASPGELVWIDDL